MRDRTTPAYHVDGQVKGLQAVDAGLLQHPLPDRIRHGARDFLCEPAGGRAVRLHPDRVYNRVGPQTIGHLAYRLSDVVVLLGVPHLDTIAARPLDPLWHDGDEPQGQSPEDEEDRVGHPQDVGEHHEPGHGREQPEDPKLQMSRHAIPLKLLECLP